MKNLITLFAVTAFVLAGCAPTVPASMLQKDNPPTPRSAQPITVVTLDGKAVEVVAVACEWGVDTTVYPYKLTNFLYCYGKEFYLWQDWGTAHWIQQYDTSSIVYSGQAQYWRVKAVGN